MKTQWEIAEPGWWTSDLGGIVRKHATRWDCYPIDGSNSKASATASTLKAAMRWMEKNAKQAGKE